MEFIDHTLQWCRGEILEGKISLFSGIILGAIAFICYKWGGTAYTKAIFWPLAVVAIFAVGAGVYLIRTNQQRLKTYEETYRQNPEEFVRAEKLRTADFIKWYPITQKIFFAVMITGMLCLILSKSPIVRSVGFGLMLLSFYVFVLDHFSEERAVHYQTKIIEQLAK